MGLKREKFKKMEDLLLQGQKLCRCWKIAERIWRYYGREESGF
ncbi:hypothetical protein C807_01613 [Lachnospiraceae bacterium 28-4]|nr:hypothetical protein C807_01613 [Lachnospiraceae bacterium 28-4]